MSIIVGSRAISLALEARGVEPDPFAGQQTVVFLLHGKEILHLPDQVLVLRDWLKDGALFELLFATL